MDQPVVLLVVGFVLTSGLGGLLGYFFQNRAWDRSLQLSLQRAGAAALVADGHFGRGTERALRDFQAARGIHENGVAGPLTLETLDGVQPGVASPSDSD